MPSRILKNDKMINIPEMGSVLVFSKLILIPILGQALRLQIR